MTLLTPFRKVILPYFSENLRNYLQPFAEYFGKNKKIRKFRHDQKTLISVFAYFLSVSAKNLFLQERLDTMLYRMHFSDFADIFLFPKVKS